MAIKMMRLVNGDDIIGEEVVKEKTMADRKIYLKKPAILGMMQGQDGKPNIGMADYLVFSDPNHKEIGIEPQSILFEYTPSSEIEQGYRTKFGSGLVFPPKQLTL